MEPDDSAAALRPPFGYRTAHAARRSAREIALRRPNDRWGSLARPLPMGPIEPQYLGEDQEAG